MTRGCFVAWPLDAEAVPTVRDAVRDELADADERGVAALLPDAGAATVSVFLRRADSDAPQFVWYVEYEDSEAWADPATVVREHSPLFQRVASCLADGAPTVVAHSAADAVELVHAGVPGRPAVYADRTDALPAFCSGGDLNDASSDAPGADRPEIVPLVLRVRGGVGSLFARALAGLFERTPTWLEAKFEAASLDVMAEEGMHTETLLLERDADGYAVWWYMESGGMERVKDAYYASDSAIARVSEHVLGWVLERPERALVHPVEASEFELLAHAVAPNRD